MPDILAAFSAYIFQVSDQALSFMWGKGAAENLSNVRRGKSVKT